VREVATHRHPDPQRGPASTAPQDDVIDAVFEPVTESEPAAVPPPAGVPDDESATVVAELEDRWRRALADLDNLRKRYARELARERAAERARVAAAFLPMIDNLELALGHAGDAPAAFVEGIRAVRDQAIQTLTSLGYPRQDDLGVPFDPNRHEAVGVVDATDAPPGSVVQVVRPGYGVGERMLRPAAVIVAGGRGE
jgi:molecular chaperone GrpE